jgi:predicted CopG family antitoxin
MSATEQIRISAELKAELEKQKRPGESYNDVLQRLVDEQVERRREAIRAGAGLWEGTDAADTARAARESMKEDVGPDA